MNQPLDETNRTNQTRTEKRSCGFRILSYHKKAWSNIAFVDHAFLCFFFSHEKKKRKAYARHDITGRRKGDPQAIQRRRFTYPEKPTLYWSPASAAYHRVGEVTTPKKEHLTPRHFVGVGAPDDPRAPILTDLPSAISPSAPHLCLLLPEKGDRVAVDEE